MTRTTLGTFGGFDFDAEVFADYMQELPTWSNAIIASNIVAEDSSIMGLIGDKGNVATLPFYKAISIDDFEPMNNDGFNNNTPSEIEGGKQTAMLIQRMQAWKAKDFTKELTGADPMAHVARSVNDYYMQVWERELMNIANTVMSLEAMNSHVYDIALAEQGSVTDANKIDATTMIFAEQKALGDNANKLGIAIMHSNIFAKYKALGLVDYNKYTITNALAQEVNLPTINGMIPLVSDRYTVRENAVSKQIEYVTTIIGEGAFLGARKTNYENPYYTDYDAETNAGVEKLYTKEGRVIHPNGFSFKADEVAKESPTFAELGTTDNWSLKFNAKNVRIGQIISNG